MRLKIKKDNYTDAKTNRHHLSKTDNIMDNWISVEDRLPDYDELVIVYGQRKLSQPSMGGNPDMVTTGMRMNIKGTGIERQRERYVDNNEFRQMNYVTHWQPLPSPPPPTKSK